MLCLAIALFAGPVAPLHPWGEPRVGEPLIVLRNQHYDCGFDVRLRVARWVGYIAVGTDKERRRYPGGFSADPRLDSVDGPRPSDYSGCGRRLLDRGHQAPDATLRIFGPKGQRETYYLSDITPQHRALNRKLWQELEQAIRDWSGGDETAWVVTGPVYFAGRDTEWLSARRVAVPHAYFCSISRRGQPEVLTLLVANAPDTIGWARVWRLLVSVDSVEKLTGLDLFPKLTRTEATKLESRAAPALWPGPR